MYDQKEDIRKEKIRTLRLIPVAILIMLVDAGVFIFLGSDNWLVSQNEMPGVTRHLWLFSTVLFVGIAICCFIGTLMSLIWLHIVAIKLKMRVNILYALWRSAKQLLLGFFVIWIYHISIQHINANSTYLNQNFYYPLSGGNFLLDIGFAFVCFFLSIAFGSAIFGLLGLPFSAAEDAEKIKEESWYSDQMDDL